MLVIAGVLVVLFTFNILVGVVTVTSSDVLFVPIKLLVVAVVPVLVTMALLLYLPVGTELAISATKVIATLLLGGMLNVPQVGEVAPTAGLTVVVRVAVPLSTGALFEAKVNPVGNTSLIETLVKV